jgi:hypothetical protein
MKFSSIGRLLIVCVFLGTAAQAQPSESIEGIWKGAVAGEDLVLQIINDDGAWRAALGAPDAEAEPLPVQALEVQDERVVFEAPPAEGDDAPMQRFSLYLDDDVLVGTVRREGFPPAPVLFAPESPPGEDALAATGGSSFGVTSVTTEEEWDRATVRLAKANNLRQFALACRRYARENSSNWPPFTDAPGVLMASMDALYPTFLDDPMVLVDPEEPDAATSPEQVDNYPQAVFNDDYYWYIPFALIDEDMGMLFIKAYKESVQAGNVPVQDIKVEVEDADAPEVILRLREDVPLQLAEEGDFNARNKLRASIPVLIERPDIDAEGAPFAHVLFMDGRVERLTYPGPFPLTEDFIGGLRSLDDLQQADEEQEPEED